MKVVLVPAEECLALPDLMRMRRARFDERGLRCEAYGWDRTEEVVLSWDRILLASCGRIEVQKLVEVEIDVARAIPFRRDEPKDTRLVSTPQFEFVMDVFAEEPALRLRLDHNTAAYSFARMAESEESAVAIHRAALQIERYGADVPANRGVRLLARDAPGEQWADLTFVTKPDFDAYSLWLLQRLKYGILPE